MDRICARKEGIRLSSGKWSPLSCPNGHKEDAELAARMEDIAARLHSAMGDMLIVSRLVRQIEVAGKKEDA